MNKGSIMLLVTLLILWLSSDSKAATIWGSTDRSPATSTMRFPVDISAVSTPGYLDVDDLNTYIWANPTGVLPTTNGGLGVNLTAPGADRILFWDDSAAQYQYLTAGTGLAITGTTIEATSAGSGTVTSVNLSGGTTGLTYSGGPVTTSGTITTAGTLAVANGGTGATSAGNAQVNLNLIPGVDIMAFNRLLDQISAFPGGNSPGPSENNFVIWRYDDPSTNDGFLDYAEASTGLQWDPAGLQVSTALQAWNSKSAPSGDVVGTSDTQELTNKTLSDPVAIDFGTNATGDIYYRDGAGDLERLPIGTSGSLLRVASGVPGWTPGTALTGSNLSGCGTSPAITGTDRKGTLTIGSGNAGCTITFSSAYASAPVCLIAPANEIATQSLAWIASTSTTTFVIDSTNGVGGEIYTYMCEG